MATELSESEEKLIKSIRELGLRPDANSAEELKEWLRGYHDDDDDDDSDEDTQSVVDETHTKTLRLANTPKLSTFYGDVEKLTKGEVVYDQWYYEVQSLVEENHRDKHIQQAIRRSVKGSAAKVLKRIPVGSSTIDILKTFESVYGAADSRATTLRNFYSAEQEESENVRDWSCRLEELLDKAKCHGLIIKGDKADAMLCDKFWSGLRPELRDKTGHKYDSIHDFDELRTEVKKIEYEHHRKEKKPVTSTAKRATNTTEKDSTKAEIEELRGMIQQVASSVENIGQEVRNLSSTSYRQQPSRDPDRSGCSQYQQQPDYDGGHQVQYNRGARPRQQSGYSQGPSHSYSKPPQHSNFNRGYDTSRTGPSQYSRDTDRNREEKDGHQTPKEHGARGTMFNGDRQDSYRRDDYYQGPICYRCGQRGHIQRYCRVRTDHLRLN